MRAIPTVAEHRAWATISFSALKANLNLARQVAPNSALVAVIKADAYGHGILPVAYALRNELTAEDCFGVATVEEATLLRRAGIVESILLLEGFVTKAELQSVIAHGFQCVIHSLYQLEYLLQYYAENSNATPISLWLKADTGMHRLGLNGQEFAEAWQCLKGHALAGKIVCMTHLACADALDSDQSKRQVALLQEFIANAQIPRDAVRISIAASGGILNWSDMQFDLVRPGIMLYGGSSAVGQYGEDKGLLPVMTLSARLIAIKSVAAGEAVGYGATYTCKREQRIGIVSIGYGDGYPRHAPSGTPVLIKHGSEQLRVGTLGRVSMDMIAIDLNECPNASIGDTIVLWGEGLPADEIAELCGTISYELFCQVTSRVHYIYS
jgi:alanine racemase